MTNNCRILINVFATYGRTLVGIICGIFSIRWILAALGHQDFGLYSVIGSLSIFLNFLNIQLSAALGRFFAVSIGRRSVAGLDEKKELEECRRWFSCGVIIHVIVPLILVLAGWLIGSYGIRNGWLTIPTSRIEDCVWLWRFACISSFVSMVNAPFQAMYVAKQYIAELTVYSLLQTLLKTMFIFSMTLISMDWLVWYGLGMCFITIVPSMLICARATCVFDECRLITASFFDLNRIRKIALYAWWQMLGGLGFIARHQCMEIVVNRYFGPCANAAYTVGATFGAEANSLTGALNSAFCPVVSTAFGAGDLSYMKKMAFRMCKFGTALTLMFAIPMVLEADEILKLWLKNPPDGSANICTIMILVVVVGCLSLGHGMAVNATGNVAKFQAVRGALCLLAVPLAVLSAAWWNVVDAIVWTLLVITVLMVVSDIVIARTKAGMRVSTWWLQIVVPIILIAVLTYVIGRTPSLLLEQSIWRIGITTLFSLAAYIPLIYFILFDDDERKFVSRKFHALLIRR